MQRDSHGETMLEQTDSVSESSENTGLQAGAQNVHFGLNKKHIILRLNIEHSVRQSILLPTAALHLFDAFVQTFASPVCTNWEQFGGSGSCSRTLKKIAEKDKMCVVSSAWDICPYSMLTDHWLSQEQTIKIEDTKVLKKNILSVYR